MTPPEPPDPWEIHDDPGESLHWQGEPESAPPPPRRGASAERIVAVVVFGAILITVVVFAWLTLGR